MDNELISGLIGGIISGFIISFINAVHQKSINTHTKLYEISIEASEIFDLIIRSQMDENPQYFIDFKERLKIFKSKYLSLLEQEEQSYLSTASSLSDHISSIERFISENSFPEPFTKAGINAYNLKESLTKRVRNETRLTPNFLQSVGQVFAFKTQGGF